MALSCTGKVYVYGTLDAKGNTKNFASLGLEEGDEVTIQGPKTTYGTTVELVDVTVLKINKSLIKVDSVYNDVLPVEGGIFEAYIITKGNGVSVEIPEDAKEWLSIVSIDQKGTDACVKFRAARNEGGDRSTSITFRTTDGKKDYTSKTELSQQGAIVEATVAEFIAAEVGATQYRISGVVTKIANTQYGNIYIKDFSGDVYIYGIKDFADSNIKEGDIVTLVGPRAEYKGTPQMTNAVAEDVKSVKTVTVADFLAAEESPSQYYQLTGTVSNIASTLYGNFDITDESGKVYVYGLLTGWKGALRRFRSESIEVFWENDTWRRDKFEIAVAFYDDAIRSNVVSLQIFGEQLTGDGETSYAAGERRRLRLWERINRNGCGRRGTLYLYADFTSAIEEGFNGIGKIDRAANNRASEIDTGDGELAFLLREDKVL